VEWYDNIDISDMSPKEYYPKLAKRFSKSELEQMAYWHALPSKWYEMDYMDFVKERRKLMAKVVRDGFGKLPQ
jgi:hypothetical protein